MDAKFWGQHWHEYFHQEATLDQLRPTFTWNCLKYTYYSIWIPTTWGYISAADEDDTVSKY